MSLNPHFLATLGEIYCTCVAAFSKNRGTSGAVRLHSGFGNGHRSHENLLGTQAALVLHVESAWCLPWSAVDCIRLFGDNPMHHAVELSTAEVAIEGGPVQFSEYLDV